MSEIVRTTKVETDDKDLTVSTVKLAPNYYDTVIFDDHQDHRHNGKRIGDWIIDHLNKRDETREAAMDTHREAIHTARTEPIR